MRERWRFAPALLLTLGVLCGAARAQGSGDQTRIGVFDPETLWKLTEVGKRYNADLTEARDRLQAEIDRKSQELEDLKDKLRQQQASLSEEKIQQIQKEILNKRTELDRMNEDATKEMKFQLNDVQSRFQQMLVETVEIYGKEKNLALILNKGVIDYNAPQVDITQDLIARFNAMHKAPAPSTAKAPARKAPEKPKEPPKSSGGA
ncbi:MAG: OmpH family outer membrane protein [Acidobacteria bacterium]|nr:OmpH family outer membrane protein [Acidobacteriota bacterium]